MQVPDEQVKEMTTYSLEMLKKMEQARVEGKYHEVHYSHLTEENIEAVVMS